MHMAGDNFVSLSGVSLYCSMARWNASDNEPVSMLLPFVRLLLFFFFFFTFNLVFDWCFTIMRVYILII